MFGKNKQFKYSYNILGETLNLLNSSTCSRPVKSAGILYTSGGDDAMLILHNALRK